MKKWLAWMIPLAFVAACAHKEEVKVEPPVAATPAAAPETPAASAEHPCAQDADCGARQLCVQSRCTDITSGMAECQETTVHFAFDRSDVEPQELSLLQRVSRCLMAEQSAHVVIEGNADERGTAEYNLALGDRRANAVDKYLVSLGVPAAQLKTVSYGKEKPLCREHSEECWAKNRRAALKNTAPKPEALR